MKDILSIPVFRELHDQAQAIVRAFNRSPLRLARLRKHQVAIYGGKRALCSSVITRWGTQYRLINSILKSKDALRRFSVSDTAKELSLDAYTHISSAAFWKELEPVRELLQPMDEAITDSESSKGHIGQVINRWKAIHSHLIQFQ